MFGNGVIGPFLIIYLHNVRGISLGVAGLVVASNSAAGLVSGFVGGALSDRLGPRTVLSGALVVMAVAFGLFPLIRAPWHAFALNMLAGAGSGSFWPSQSTLLSSLTPQARRHAAFAQQRMTMNLGIALGGLVAGAIARTDRPGTFTFLFLLNAATFLVFIAVLRIVPAPRHREAHHEPGRYADVVRNRTFLSFVVLNVIFIGAGIAVMAELLPPFAKNTAHVSEPAIGVLWFVFSGVVALAQLPVVKLVEGKAPDAGTGADGGGLGRDVRGGARRWKVVHGHAGGGRLRDRGGGLRAGRVPPRRHLRSAGRRPRGAATARPLHGGLQLLVAARLARRPCRGRVRPPARAAHALAGGGGNLPPRVRLRARARGHDSVAAAPHAAGGFHRRRGGYDGEHGASDRRSPQYRCPACPASGGRGLAGSQRRSFRARNPTSLSSPPASSPGSTSTSSIPRASTTCAPASAGIRWTSRTFSPSGSARRSTTTPTRVTASASSTFPPTTRRSSG